MVCSKSSGMLKSVRLQADGLLVEDDIEVLLFCSSDVVLAVDVAWSPSLLPLWIVVETVRVGVGIEWIDRGSVYHGMSSGSGKSGGSGWPTGIMIGGPIGTNGILTLPNRTTTATW